MPDNNNEVNLDTILGTGENTDRKPTEVVENPVEVINDGSGDDKSTVIDGVKPTEGEQTTNEKEVSIDNLFETFQDVNVSNLSEEDKQTRQDLLDKFKGVSFDNNGNMLDDKGEVVKTKEDLVNYANEGDEQPYINELIGAFDYEFVDEDGKPKVYEDSTEGIKQFVTDSVLHQLEEFKSRFFNQNPELAEISKHLLSGGSIKDFKEPIDYSKIDVTTLSTDQKLQKIRESLQVKNVADEQIQSYLDLVKGSNIVDAEVGKALKVLTAHDKDASIARDAKYQQTIEDNNKRVEEHWNKVETTITQGKLGNIEIPKEDRQAFNDYVSLAVTEDGKSQDMLDKAKEGLDQTLVSAYYRFKGYDLEKLVNNKVKQQKVQSLRDRIKRSDSIKATPINDTSKSKTSGGKDVSIDTLLP